MAGHGFSGRWLARVVAVTAVALAAAGVAAAGASAAPSAHSASRTATLVIRPAAVGKYEVIVSVRARGKHSRVVHVYLTGQPMQTVRANPWWGARVYYTMALRGGKLTVRTVNAAPAVQVRASLILRSAITKPKTTTSASGSAPAASTPPPAATPAPTPTPTPPPPPPNPPYSQAYTSLTWDEEFTGTAGSAADSNWVYDTGPACGDPGCSVSTTSTANASLDGNGNLAINALRSGNGYTAAQLETIPSVTFHAGEELDARIKLPAGQGLWGGFWFYQSSTTSIWNGPLCAPANCGELDVLEAPEFGPTPNADYFDLHGPTNGSNQQQWEASESSLGDLSAGYHVFGVTWQPGVITWTIDGTPYASATPASLVAGSSWQFDGGSYRMLLDLATGGWPGPPAASTPFPATMLVDWVRVYKAP